MSMNKKLLAAAIAGLLFSANAGAVVLGVDDARVYASEIANGTTLTDLDDDIEFQLGYNFSGGEVRYGRLECTDNLTLDNATIAEGSADITLGAINGQGTRALFFSITAANPVSGATENVVLNVDADNTLEDGGNVNCAFSIYDQPSQAQAGGLTGQIYSTGFEPFIERQSGFVFSTTSGTAVADVAADPAYTQFVGGVNEFGTLTFEERAGVLDVDGTQIELFDIFDSATRIRVFGDFSAASDVSWNGISATETDTSATFAYNDDGLAAISDGNSGTLRYHVNGTDEIFEDAYRAELDAVANTGYVVSDQSLANVGNIERNGVELQAPLVQTTSGFISRIALTNTGGVDRQYSIRVINESGNALTTNSTALVGTIPGNGQKVIDLNTVITGFTTLPRGAVIVTVDAPNDQIQGLYQIVNPANGAISNETMTRPGQN